MKKPSAELRIEDTNDLLAQIPGLGFRIEGKQNMTGGKGPKVDSQMQVEDTNSMVESITGGGLKALNESGPKSSSHRPLHEEYADEDSLSDLVNALKENVESALSDLGGAANDQELTESSKADVKADLSVLKQIHSKVLALVAEAKRLKTV